MGLTAVVHRIREGLDSPLSFVNADAKCLVLLLSCRVFIFILHPLRVEFPTTAGRPLLTVRVPLHRRPAVVKWQVAGLVKLIGGQRWD
jgi:hypothetical protein